LGKIKDGRKRLYWISAFLIGGAVLAIALIRQASGPVAPLLIGYADSAPYHFRNPDGSPAGAAYEIVAEAAKRAKIDLVWVYCPEESEAALRSGKVDLWPIIGDFPDRRKHFYISDPWISTDYFILAPKGAGHLTSTFTGNIGYSSGGVRSRLIKRIFPASNAVRLDSLQDLIAAVCSERVAAGIFEAGESRTALEARAPGCNDRQLQAYPIRGLRVDFGVGAKSGLSYVANRIQREIHGLAREGFLLSTLAKYSIFDIGDITATYSLMQLQERQRFLHWGLAALSLGLAFTLLVCWSLYRTKQAVARADSEKAESVIRYALASRATKDAIWDWSPSTDQVTWSELIQSDFGYSGNDIGRDMAWRNERIHPDERDSVLKSMERALEEGRTTWSADYRFRRKNGKYASVVDRACIVYDGGSKPQRVVGAISDMTHQRILEEQLRQAQKMEAVGRLAGGVAHDFNNLLTVITGYSQLMLLKAEEKSLFHEYATKIQKAAASAASLTQQLLAFSRRQAIEPKAIDLNVALAEAEAMLKRLLEENIETVIHCSPEPCMVLAEIGQLHQVVMNLATNARDAMPQGGRLLFELSNVELASDYVEDHAGVKPGAYVLMAVTDTGSGMDEETQRHIFEPFFTTKSKGVGTGLGLSTVQGIVEQNGGSIWVYSELGKGTSFKIYLPRVKAPVAVVKLPQSTTSPTAPAGETILIVEDHAEVRRVASESLRYHGYCVVEATSAEEALLISEKCSGTIDVMVTDVVLPGMSGRELAEQIGPRRPGMKILYVSGYTENVIAHQGILIPGIAFLAKPFSQQALLDKIRQLLGAS